MRKKGNEQTSINKKISNYIKRREGERDHTLYFISFYTHNKNSIIWNEMKFILCTASTRRVSMYENHESQKYLRNLMLKKIGLINFIKV